MIGKAISGMKKAGHSMQAECSACEGGMCKYAEGGDVSPYDKAGSDISKSIPAPAAQSMANAFGGNKKMAKGGEVDKGRTLRTGKSDERGVNEVLPRYNKDKQRMEHGNSRYESDNDATVKYRQKRTLEELKSMPNPKLKGLADGGEVDDMGPDADDDSMMDQCAGELLDAIQSKDKQGILESLKALIMSVKG